MRGAAERGEQPFAAAVELSHSLFSTQKVPLGVEHSLATGPRPVRLVGGCGARALVRRPVTEMLNSAGEWEPSGADASNGSLGDLLVRESDRWVPRARLCRACLMAAALAISASCARKGSTAGRFRWRRSPVTASHAGEMAAQTLLALAAEVPIASPGDGAQRAAATIYPRRDLRKRRTAARAGVRPAAARSTRSFCAATRSRRASIFPALEVSAVIDSHGARFARSAGTRSDPARLPRIATNSNTTPPFRSSFRPPMPGADLAWSKRTERPRDAGS